MLSVILIVVGWITSGVLAAGARCAYGQYDFPILFLDNRSYWVDDTRTWMITLFILGPIGSIATLVTGQFKYGLMYGWLSYEAILELAEKDSKGRSYAGHLKRYYPKKTWKTKCKSF